MSNLETSEANIAMSNDVRQRLGLPSSDPALAEALSAWGEGELYLLQHPTYDEDLAEIVATMNLVGGYHELAALGPRGSNSHIVATDLGNAVKARGRRLRQSIDGCDIEPASMLRRYRLTEDFPAILQAVATRRIMTLGILPVINTVGREVRMSPQSKNLDVIRRAGARVLGVVDLPIEHCLLGTGGVDPEDLEGRTVHSHPQAIAQCSQRIASLGLRSELAKSTSAAAAAVARGELGPDALAIAPRLAGEIYGLQPIEEDIGNLNKNENITVMAVVGISDYGSQVAYRKPRPAVGERTGYS
jgi:prephenate dehydratase